MVIGLPVLVLYGAVVPWRVADDALAEYRGFPKLLIGASYRWRSTNGHDFEKISRTYLILPHSLSIPAAVTVVSTNGAVEVAAKPASGSGIVLAYVLALCGTWWFWLRPSRQRRMVVEGRR